VKIKKLIDYLIINIMLPPLLNFYEHFIMYRIREAWGIVHLSKIKNKGYNVKLVGYSRILSPNNLKLGNNVRIGYGCFLFAMGGIEIDDNTILSRNITIYSSNHNFKSNVVPYNNEYINKPVRIGKSVWIGMNVSITPGVNIGDGAIIGMGTVISKDVEPGAIVVGPGQREISKRDIIDFNKNQNENRIYSVLYPND
jgi:acetyltransferase-like isoleucine patch superfamily enzyme